jgi:hypothetical protein
MRTYEAKAYTFDELSDQAKDAAKQDYFSGAGYSWSEDALASLKAFAEAFDAKLSDYQIDWFNCTYSSAEFSAPEMSRREVGRRLRALGTYDKKTLRGHGECKLTGYCSDEDALDGMRKAYFAGESDLGELLQEGFWSWLKAAQADAEYQYSDEAFLESCKANDYEFDESGHML